MMGELYRAALEQRLSSRLRILLAVGVNFIGGFGLDQAFPFGYVTPALTAWIVTSGVLGKEFSSATPQLVFARPVRRSTWVLARGLACVTCLLLFNLVSVGLSLIIMRMAHSPGPNPGQLLVAELGGVGACAVVLGLSALSTGFADLAFLAGGGLVVTFLFTLAQSIHDPDLGYAVSAVSGFLRRLLFPALSAGGYRSDTVTVGSTLAFVAVVLGWLVVAVAAAARREITYATE